MVQLRVASARVESFNCGANKHTEYGLMQEGSYVGYIATWFVVHDDEIGHELTYLALVHTFYVMNSA